MRRRIGKPDKRVHTNVYESVKAFHQTFEVYSPYIHDAPSIIAVNKNGKLRRK